MKIFKHILWFIFNGVLTITSFMGFIGSIRLLSVTNEAVWLWGILFSLILLIIGMISEVNRQINYGK